MNIYASLNNKSKKPIIELRPSRRKDRLFKTVIKVMDYEFIQSRIDSEKAMAPHSSTLAWKTPWTEEPGRLQSMGSRRVRRD